MFSRKTKNVLRRLPFFLIVTAIVATIGFFSWLNHNDFERAMVKQAQKTLTMIARLEAQSFEKNFRFLEGPFKDMEGLVDFLYLIDDKGNILSSSDRKDIGKNVLSPLGEALSHPEVLKIKEIVTQMSQGKEGTAVVSYLPTGANTKNREMLISFTPVRIGNDSRSVAVGMDYSDIIGPINRNARDNLLFAAFVVVILSAAWFIFYKSEKKNVELSISKTCLDLINKQLHLEIEKRKEIEKRLKESLKNGG